MVPGPPAEGVLEAVGHELVRDQPERHRLVHRHHQALDLGPQVHPRRLPGVQPQQARPELAEVGAQVHALDLARGVELLVHQAQRPDPAADRAQLAPGLRAPGAALLQADEAGDRLQVVLDPVLQLPQQPPLVGHGRPQLAQDADALDRLGQQVGVGAQEVGVGPGEPARLAAVDLEDAVGRLAVRRRGSGRWPAP